MKIIDGHDVIEHAEVNGEDREFIRKLMDYIEDADVVETLYCCDRKRCENCNSDCFLTRDKSHAGKPPSVIIIDGIEMVPSVVEPKTGDLIKREDAERYFGEFLLLNRFADFKKANIEKLVGKLCERIPSAEPKQEWIPCSERLPEEEFGTYLICTENGYMCSCRWTNDMYGLGQTEWSKWGWHIMDKPQYSVVGAWMPIEPWEGADDE